MRRAVELLAEYESRQDLLRDYPDLEPGDLTQALQYAASNLDGSIEFHIHAA